MSLKRPIEGRKNSGSPFLTERLLVWFPLPARGRRNGQLRAYSTQNSSSRSWGVAWNEYTYSYSLAHPNSSAQPPSALPRGGRSFAELCSTLTGQGVISESQNSLPCLHTIRGNRSTCS